MASELVNTLSEFKQVIDTASISICLLNDKGKDYSVVRATFQAVMGRGYDNQLSNIVTVLQKYNNIPAVRDLILNYYAFRTFLDTPVVDKARRNRHYASNFFTFISAANLLSLLLVVMIGLTVKVVFDIPQETMAKFAPGYFGVFAVLLFTGMIGALAIKDKESDFYEDSLAPIANPNNMYRRRIEENRQSLSDAISRVLQEVQSYGE